MAYIDNLEEIEIQFLELVLSNDTTVALRTDKASDLETMAAEHIDYVIANAPSLSSSVTVYRTFADGALFRDGGKLEDPAFLAGSTRKPKERNGKSATLAIKIPAGTKALALPDGVYVLPRGVTLDLEPTESGPIPAMVKSIPKQTGFEALVEFGVEETDLEDRAGIFLTPKTDEFHLLGQHDQSTHGRPQGGPEGGRGIPGAQRAGTRPPGALAAKKPRELPPDYHPKPGVFTPAEQKAIRDAGHNPADYMQNGKPIPSTDAWLDAHGISREVYDTRPMLRWENRDDPLFEEHFGEFTKEKGYEKDQKAFAQNHIANQSAGFIMVRKPVPGSPFGPMPPQARPDKKVVVDGRLPAKKERELRNAKSRLEVVNGYTPDDMIAERQRSVNTAKKELKDVQTKTPRQIIQEAENRNIKAQVELKRAQKSGDEDRISQAKREQSNSEFFLKEEKRRAAELRDDPDLAVKLAKQFLARREEALVTVKGDPKRILNNVRAHARNEVAKKEQQLEETAVKYAFPPGPNSASRIEANQDKQNIKNLTQGKGRVYFAMEGNIKADALLTQVKKEDPKAAVISVPSVTLWPPEKDGETEWVAQKYLKGRDVILIPDADGVTNRNVSSQAVQLKGKLLQNGVKNVYVSAPPLIRNERGRLVVDETLKFPTGAKEGRKGVDDHLGLGRGTLGDLVFDDNPPPKFDLTEYTNKERPRSQRMNKGPATENSTKTLNAISDLAGEDGIGRISGKAITKYSGVADSSVTPSLERLERVGIIKVHYIFDPVRASQGRREPTMEYDDAVKLARRAGIKDPNFETPFLSKEDQHEAAPIIEIINPRYITKRGDPTTLASKYKTLKTSQASAAFRGAQAAQAAQRPSRPGIRLVRTAEGARRYGVSIGQPIPVLKATGIVHLNDDTVDLHLVGQHDQSNHGRPGGGESVAQGIKLLDKPISLRERIAVEGSNDLKNDFDRSVKAIDSVHKVPTNILKRDLVVSEASMKRGTGGTYVSGSLLGQVVPGTPFLPNVIVMRKKDTKNPTLLDETRPATSMLHNLGYYVNDTLSGFGGSKSPAKDDELKKAVSQSPQVGRLPGGIIGKYYSKDRVVFARAYNQWIIEKSGDRDLKTMFNQYRTAEPGLQWTDDEFKPISKEMDRIFQEKGLLNQ